MGDRHRFREFSSLVADRLPTSASLVDVAGGKGHLQAALRGHGFKNILTVDKRKNMAKAHRLHLYRYGWFSYNEKQHFDGVVAMHPDGGTDHSILYAVRNSVPFLVCPCCIVPSATSFWRRKDFSGWVEHLKELATETHQVDEVKLKIDGRNLVLVGTPYGRRNQA